MEKIIKERIDKENKDNKELEIITTVNYNKNTGNEINENKKNNNNEENIAFKSDEEKSNLIEENVNYEKLLKIENTNIKNQEKDNTTNDFSINKDNQNEILNEDIKVSTPKSNSKENVW